jgi:hypothetical protein
MQQEISSPDLRPKHERKVSFVSRVQWLMLTAIVLWVPAGICNAYFRSCELRFAADLREQEREMEAMAEAAKLYRQQATLTNPFYGTREDLANLPSTRVTSSSNFMHVSHEIGGRVFQLQIHECPIGARDASDKVYSGLLLTWNEKTAGFQTVAEIHSLGALSAAGYTLHKS